MRVVFPSEIEDSVLVLRDIKRQNGGFRLELWETGKETGKLRLDLGWSITFASALSELVEARSLAQSWFSLRRSPFVGPKA